MTTAPVSDPVDVAREVARLIIEPNAGRWDAEARWPEEAVRALQQRGLGGLMVPSVHGGLGRGMSTLVRVCEQLGYADASTALCYGMHCVATACLAAKATERQVATFLEPIAAGEHWTTLALSEAGTGSHFYLPQASMRRDRDCYHLAGTKCFVTNGGHADSYVVSTTANHDTAPGEFTMVMVPAPALEGRWHQAWDGWGMRGNSSCSVSLDEVQVPVDNRLGAEGDQIWYVFNVVAPCFLVAMAGTYLGIAARAVDEARGHLQQREYAHTGAPLSEISVLQHRLGTMWAELQRSRRLCYWAAAEADDEGEEALPALCAAKADVVHAAVSVVNEAMTLAGGQGYRDGSELQRLLRDARAGHVMSPTTDILYTWAARALLGLPLLGT